MLEECQHTVILQQRLRTPATDHEAGREPAGEWLDSVQSFGKARCTHSVGGSQVDSVAEASEVSRIRCLS